MIKSNFFLIAYLWVIQNFMIFAQNNRSYDEVKICSIMNVENIEIHKNFYILHLSFNNKYYKVVSHKSPIDNSNEPIKKSKKYNFDLEPMLFKGNSFPPYPKGIIYTDWSIINMEDNPLYIKNIFQAKNLNGLYIIKKE